GHHDANNTTCPGSDLYAKLSTIRSVARSLLGTIAAPVDDFTSDLATDATTWDPVTGNWHIGRLSNTAHYGLPGDVPVPGNYLGNMTTERAVWRPSEGNWYVLGLTTPVR